MTPWTLIRRGLRYHAGANLRVGLGVAVGGAALSGALIVGDSVRGSLQAMALQRLAGASVALNAQDRFFETTLFQRILAASPNRQVSENTGPDTWQGSPLIQLPAIASRQDGAARANRVQLFGVDERYFGSTTAIAPGEVLLNNALARQLNAHPGDQVLFRVQKPSALSREAVISPRANAGLALRFKVAGIAPPQRAALNLHSTPGPAPNAFVRLDELGAAVDLTNRANLLLFGTRPPSLSLTNLEASLNQTWRLADAETSLIIASNRQSLELRTRRVFLDRPITRAALAANSNALPMLTFLANLIQKGTNYAPYSMITAVGAPFTPPDLRDDEIVLTRWLADDLNAAPGDAISVTAFDPESGARLVERTNTFRVRTVVPPEPLWDDRSLMPDFPGIEKAESTQDWDAGFPLVHKIRPQDEAWWKKYKGTPKAFVTLAAGKKLWANRFGELTAVRFSLPAGTDAERARSELESRIAAGVRPNELGLRFEPVRDSALRAASQSQDFGQLFLGFSFFLIAASLLLMALLFQFGLEQRATETGTLLALGFKPGRVRLMYLGEGAALAVIGGVLGALAGLAYAKLMLWGLTTIWRDAIGSSVLALYTRPATIFAGIFISAALAVMVIWLTLRRQAGRPARELLAGEIEIRLRKSRGWAKWIAVAAGATAVATAAYSLLKGETANVEAFFSAGALLLIAGLASVSAWFSAQAQKPASSRPTLTGLGVRGCVRRSKRSLSTVALLACGAFLILAIGIFRLDASVDALRRDSGTGGFALIGESALPVLQDLNAPAGRESLGLPAPQLVDVGFVPFRVRAGDDASCLNLNRAQQPRLLGIKPELLAGRFTFTKAAEGLDLHRGWRLLENSQATDEIAAIGDANSIQWALGKKVGETLDYTDEQGRTFRLRLVGSIANSILQGNLVIDEAAFIRKFPAEAGFRMFLMDAPSNRVTEVSANVSRALQDEGLELTPTAQRLNDFNAVQNTYLGTFQVLGGLGLLLGSIGLGIVVLRNVSERRGEIGVMTALGFRRGELHRLVLSEHAALLALGLGIGALAAVLAVLPALLAPGTPLPYGSLAITLGGIWLNGLVWTWLATRRALSGNLLAALRNE